MKRNGFTLIELIFVIVIIGVLAAVAVPKFKNLKQSADAANVIKVAQDAFGAIPGAYVNAVDLEDNSSQIRLSEIVSINGKNWTISDATLGDGQTAIYQDEGSASHKVITLTFNPEDRNATMDVNCSAFADSTTVSKCTSLMGGSAVTDQNVSF